MKCPRCGHWPHDEAMDPRCQLCGCVDIQHVVERMMEAESDLANVSAEGLWHTGQHEDCNTCKQWKRAHPEA